MVEALDRMESARNYNRWLADRVRPFAGSRLLDLGAGIGTISLLLANGREITALEPDPVLAGILRERVVRREGFTVISAEGGDYLTSVDTGFDSIVCLNVLEHIEAEADTLAACCNALVPGGHMLILVPAHARLFGAVDTVGGHFRRYDVPHLRDALAAAGFEIVDLRHVNPVGALGWLMFSRLLRRDQVPRSPLGAFDRLVPLLRPLDRLRLPVGLSLWAVARRPAT